MRGIIPKLTKEYLLQRISEVDIYEHYLSKFDTSIDSRLIRYLADSGTLIESPLRHDDSTGSFGFKYNNKNKLKVRDFNGTIWGDVFDLVGYLIKEDSSSKSGFAKILYHIYAELRLQLNDSSYVHKDINIIEIKHRKTIIEPIIRDWNKYDIDIWANCGVSISTLNSEYVYPINKLYINKYANSSIAYNYDYRNPAYGYFEGTDNNNIQNWIIYFSNKDRRLTKIIQNANVIQGGLTYNDKADILIITKSKKDIMSIKELTRIYFTMQTFTVIAPSSEAVGFPDAVIRRFRNNHKVTVSLFDFDLTGIKLANKLRKLYDIEPYFFTNGRFNTIDYKAKDFSDYNNNDNRRNLVKLMESIINENKHLLHG